METPLLKDIIIIFALSIAVLLACFRLRIPNIVGFLLTGVLCGPHGLGLISDLADVQELANLGIVLLLFSVGMEFSIKKLLEVKRFFLVGGTLQVFLTIAAGFLIAHFLGRPIEESIFLGFLLSLSSTAIVLRILESKHETNTPYGKLTLSILIFQDFLAIPMMLITPFLGGNQLNFDLSFLYLIGLGLLLLILVFISAEILVPKLMFYIAQTRSRELFLLSVLTICFSVAWLSASVGLSISLGAFLAGLIVSETEYRHEAIGDILPFKDIFTSVFFVSIGMLLDLNFVKSQPLLILLATLGVLLLKSTLAAITSLIVGMPLRIAILTGVALSQVGEFSFVLAKTGFSYNIGTEYHNQLFLSLAILTMAVTPTLMHYAPKIALYASKIPWPTKIVTGLHPVELNSEKAKKKDHIIIVGYGLTGKNLAHSAREAGIDYVILEMNPDTVRKEKAKGETIYFGDATHESVLHHVNLREAKVIAVLINDTVGVMRVVELARKLNPTIYIIVRTHYIQEMKPLYQFGADDVIPDEFGSSVEIFTRVMRRYSVEQSKVEKVIEELRTEGYEMLRLFYKSTPSALKASLNLPNLGIESIPLPNGSGLKGKTVAESDLRKNWGLTIIMIKRGEELISSVDAATRLHEGDILITVGSPENLRTARQELTH